MRLLLALSFLFLNLNCASAKTAAVAGAEKRTPASEPGDFMSCFVEAGIPKAVKLGKKIVMDNLAPRAYGIAVHEVLASSPIGTNDYMVFKIENIYPGKLEDLTLSMKARVRDANDMLMRETQPQQLPMVQITGCYKSVGVPVTR